ncbi:hypothetical protein A3D78_06010 [Candidatus Gottesmanbacteria bacterium RIFCSPHIGHO2_02_FULL_39_14]|uniref:Peptidoglycan bridge formation protein FemAB n=1 Tax=Candidatus Gottesmanbacteria bacterium RIFCSPHIGHO2_02_FULL_39_14 TaxID=1798383 RepID=A0A1F5ZZE3_9BACT|nr:MAG: hypothetical protein A3D78_06010 [Candidatus Gottesmanbacteria bacterium RIFCSPHIGHO2_02_FULL_39_14]
MIRIVKKDDKEIFNRLATHPLQSWEWGEFRLKTGIEVIRLGRIVGRKMIETAQLTLHQIPFTSYQIGYLPKNNIPSEEMINKLKELGEANNLIFIKIEPKIQKGHETESLKNLVRSPHPLFTKYTFQLDITPNEEQLLGKMHSKTRYNIHLAQKKGVKVYEDNTQESFEEYLRLLEETVTRQKFYAHDKNYHRLMWETLKPAKIAHLLTAKYKPENGDEVTLVSWIVFLFNGIIYYPYGASANSFRQLMPSNLMMWEAIRFGQRHGAKLFDMWGALGPDPKPSDPWYGFHKFKEGYGPELVEFIGSFDLVINPAVYRLYNLVHGIRELYLKLTR